jgi:hypothetical protein
VKGNPVLEAGRRLHQCGKDLVLYRLYVRMLEADVKDQAKALERVRHVFWAIHDTGTYDGQDGQQLLVEDLALALGEKIE